MNRGRPGVLRRGVLRDTPARSVASNMGARLVALVSVALVTVLVARSGGAEDVGLLALMRVLPGVVGVVAACGLPGAMGFFVAGSEATHPRLWPTIHAVMLAGALVGTAAWLVLTPLIHDHLMSTTSYAVVAVTGVTVATQLPVAVGKACLQALDDSRGSNIVTAAEEAAFVPVYLLLWVWGVRGGWLLVLSLLVADVVVAVYAWVRVWRKVHRRGAPLGGRPDPALGRRMVAFGLRSQEGGILTLLNLRLDVVILGALAGPAQVGVYVVASKYAELLRLPGLALTWVTYPDFSRRAASVSSEGSVAPEAPPSRAAARRAGRPFPTMGRLLAFGVFAGVLLAASAFVVLPAVYGEQFSSAAWPAAVISLGLVAEPAAGVASGFLLGSGRPGLNSLVLGGGFAVTLALDLLLIPRHGSLGAAWASAVAYLTTDVLLIHAWRRLSQEQS